MDEKICYCYNYTTGDLEKDVIKHGRSTIMEQIITESKAGNCSCETNNPKGSWCLGDVRRVVDTVMKKEGISKKVTIPSMQL